MCPNCNKSSNKVHSYYEKSFQNLPIQGRKTIIILKNRKMFCQNSECSKKTFAEPFQFISYKAKKTKRIENEILNISINVSLIAAPRILKKNIVNVNKSTICNMLKKQYFKLIKNLSKKYAYMILH